MTTRRQPMTPLRQRLWEDLQLPNYSPSTWLTDKTRPSIFGYLLVCKDKPILSLFSLFFGGDCGVGSAFTAQRDAGDQCLASAQGVAHHFHLSSRSSCPATHVDRQSAVCLAGPQQCPQPPGTASSSPGRTRTLQGLRRPQPGRCQLQPIGCIVQTCAPHISHRSPYSWRVVPPWVRHCSPSRPRPFPQATPRRDAQAHSALW